MFSKHSKDTLSSTFDETSLDLTYHHGETQLQEIKISHKWAASQMRSRLPTLSCQWFNKAEQSMEPIPGVTEQSYQPSVLDVGTTIYIQILPESKDMEYIGMPITKFIGPLSLSPETQEQVIELIEAQKSTFFVETKSLRLQSLKCSENSSGEVRQTLLKIVKDKLVFMGKTLQGEKSQIIKQIVISKSYPQLLLNRKNCKQVTITFNKHESATFLFQGNRIRDVFYLVVQRIKEQSPDLVEEEKRQELVSQVKIKEINGDKDELKQTMAQIDVSSEESFKKAEENLPLSPQTQVLPSQQKETEESSIQSEQDFKDQKAKQLQNLQQVQKLKLQLQKQRELSYIKNQQLKDQFQKLNNEKIKAQEQACYHKNQCRLLQQQIQKRELEKQQNIREFDRISSKCKISIPEQQAWNRFGINVNLNFQELLQKIEEQQKEITELKYKNSYQSQTVQKHQTQTKIWQQQIQNNESHIKNLQKKIQSLLQSKKLLADQDNSRHTHSHQIASYQFEIGKLKEELNILRDANRVESQAKQKIIEGLKIQVKELIEENMYLRSKDKSTKGELKHQVVQLKKLVNRFAESIGEKDIQIEHLKATNKQLCKQLLRIKETSFKE